LLLEPPKDSKLKWDLINTNDDDDHIKQYDSVSCRILMLWYIMKLSNTKNKLLTLEDWDSTNKKATIHKVVISISNAPCSSNSIQKFCLIQLYL